MPTPVLVTLSGMVGAGKSSGESRIIRLLGREGIQAQSWRFRTLPCFSWRWGASRRRREASAAKPAQTVRGRDYKRRRLTLAATSGYIGRMLAFRVYRRLRQPDGWTVCNRYFYDNLAHFDLDAPEARKYLALLTRFMPRPDLAILFVASPAVIAKRRPLYSAEYLEPVWQAYKILAARFPELVVVSSDPENTGGEKVEELILGMLSRR